MVPVVCCAAAAVAMLIMTTRQSVAASSRESVVCIGSSFEWSRIEQSTDQGRLGLTVHHDWDGCDRRRRDTQQARTSDARCDRMPGNVMKSPKRPEQFIQMIEARLRLRIRSRRCWIVAAWSTGRASFGGRVFDPARELPFP